MTSKVLEAGAGIHTLGMAVAPVVSWRMYDSVYTERYMKLPATNPSGYYNASITNVTAFNNVNFLLAHGSGDDNGTFSNASSFFVLFWGDKADACIHSALLQLGTSFGHVHTGANSRLSIPHVHR